MRYRSFSDRRISTYVALTIVAVFALLMTSLILHVIASVKYEDTNLAQILN